MGDWDFLYDMADEGYSAEDIMEAQTSGASPEQWAELERQEKNNKSISRSSVPKVKKAHKCMNYDEIVIKCESLSYRDKFRLAQLLLQNGRKEEEKQNPKKRSNIKSGNPQAVKQEPTNDTNSIQYVMDRLSKLRPAKRKTLLNSIRAMYQFQGAISDKDQEAIVKKLEESKFLKVEDNNRGHWFRLVQHVSLCY